ncbi:metallophosphoesterase family protein [Paenibacillus ginsengarvi]|uniref:Metallophosphoesterase n=1 Tax=Paenibacillus ginsengarvi TaxID=400777 RepID=A0A3B0BBM8_9BACL|nr:metallophosphoesterase family protein [Paenibacillus ginsengarvi]RKN70152.1 metallophosphoesterase [Paenibacillus ginsengarvi]
MAHQTKLKFRSDGTFTIVQIADLHYAGGTPDDEVTLAVMESVLAEEKPDLVVFTGDAVKGNSCANQLEQLIDVLSVPEKLGLPYAFVFGNHDSEHDCVSREDMMEAIEGRAFCLAEAGPAEVAGVGNYTLTIAGKDGGDDPKAVLYFFDTGCGAPKSIIKSYAWLERSQIDWYTFQSESFREANGGTPLPALTFFHYPLPEYNEVWDRHTCYGVKNETVGCARLNTGMFAAMKMMGDVMGTFAGHDHTNDYCGDLYGIWLCYGRTGGPNTVNDVPYERGARVIRLTEGERGFETWLRMEDGSLVTEQPEHAPVGSVPPPPKVVVPEPPFDIRRKAAERPADAVTSERS